MKNHQQMFNNNHSVNSDKQPIKILMILENWGTGGTEAHVAQLGHYLKKYPEIEVYLIILQGWEPAALANVENWTKDIFLINKKNRREALSNFYQIARKISPDIYHLHLYSSLLPITLLLKQQKIGKLVTTLHMPITPWNWWHRLKWKLAIRFADVVTGVSTEVLKSIGMADHGKFPHAHVISPPCLPLDVKFKNEQSLQTQEKIFTVSACGRLAKEKNWPILLRAFAKFRTMVDKPVQLMHIGEGPLEQEITALIMELEIHDCVDMKGRLPHSEVLAKIATSDVFVLPSQFEGLGMVALEAMQCGTPTITADFEASVDFIEDGITGHRFARGDWSALAELLFWHFLHPNEANHIGKQGQRFVLEKYSEENTFGKYVKLYNALSRKRKI